MCPKRRLCSLPGCTLSGIGSCFFCIDKSYCSKEHQMKDWPIHKEKCFPYERHTTNLKEYGQYVTHTVLKASRDLRPGQSVTIEKPAVTFPNIDYNSPEFTDEHGFRFLMEEFPPIMYLPVKPQVCFGCNKAIPDGLKYCCNRCRIPICSNHCEEAWVHKEECEILSTLISEVR